MKKSSFLEGTFIATLSIIIVKFLGMLYVIPFYATVGVLGSALYAYAYNIYIIFLDISSAGLPTAISKLINEYNTLGQMDAKMRAYKIGKKLITFISVAVFVILFIFAKAIATMIIGKITGGNTIEDVAFVIRCVSFAILVVPYLSVAKGYLQGHKIINVSSISQIIEQVIRITIILVGSYLGIKVLHLSLKNTIGIAVFGAFVSGLCALIYIFYKMNKNREELGFNTKYEKDNVTNKEIVKKIINYAVPFIIIDIAVSIYNFIDMVLIMRTLNYLNLDAKTIEFSATAITTWSAKIGMVVNSVAMGMSVSLIPTIVSAYTLKKWKEVNDKLNQALQLILISSVPMVIGICLLSKPIWSVFYEYNVNGAIILSTHIFTSLFFNIYVITSSTLQSLNKFKAVYISTLTGFFINALLDVPLMLLFNKLGLRPYLGAVLATCIGYFISVMLALKKLKDDHKLSYKKTFDVLLKIIFSTVIMTAVVLIVEKLIIIDFNSKLQSLLYIIIIALIGVLVYAISAYKTNLIKDVFGEEYLKKIKRKLTHKR
ncbi:MAG: polysaccharide biosynthesis protein [Firmicutes bacterium]|nr:polysaccharide biosynthesis protein [Bacillota bacterium]